jgi:hypothetical protein
LKKDELLAQRGFKTRQNYAATLTVQQKAIFSTTINVYGNMALNIVRDKTPFHMLSRKKGETKARACGNAWFRQVGTSTAR